MCIRLTSWLFLASAAVLAAACQQNSGVVVASSGGLTATTVPDLMLQTADGKPWRLRDNRSSIAILAFVPAPGCDCCYVDSHLADLAERFQGLPISIVQVSELSGNCPNAGACKANARDSQNVKLLCDTKQVAMKAFGLGGIGSVFLLDGDNRVVGVSTVDNMEGLAQQAQSMAYDQLTSWQMYEGW